MTIIAELRVNGPRVTTLQAVKSVSGMHLELERAVVPGDGEPVLFLWGSGGDFDAFEAAMPSDPTIADWRVLDDTGESRLYRVDVNTDETVDSAAIDREVGASRLSIAITGEGVLVENRFPDWDALQRYVELVREADLEVSVQSVYPAGQDHRHERYGLSQKQLAMLQCALDAGYFGVPRGTDLEALAADLEISEQAASERLRRGIASLLESTVGEAPEPRGLALSSSEDGSNRPREE